MKKLLLSLLFISGFAATGYGQIYFNFGTGAANQNSTTNSNTSITATNAISNNNRANIAQITNTSTSNNYAGASGDQNLAAAIWTGTFNKATSTYFEVTLTPDAGVPVLIKGISFGTRSTGTGPTKFTVRSSIGDYDTELAGGDILANSTWVLKGPYSFDLIGTAGTEVKLRIYGYDGSGSTTANWRIDDLTLYYTTPLPVSLTSFTAKANQQNVDLAWNTASEKDNSHFDILRSGDGKTFSKIGEVKGAGNSSTAKNYAFTDKDALPGVSYYQLKQFDADGKSSDSEVIAVKSNVAASNFRVFANKQEGIVKLTIFAANEGKGSFKIYDLNGRKLTEQQLNLSKGYTNVSVPFSGANGLHVASLTTATETVTQKFIQ